MRGLSLSHISFFRHMLVGVFLCCNLIFPGVLFADVTSPSGDSSSDQSTTTYASFERADLVNPTVVRILQHVEGSAEIPSFIVDRKGTIAIDPKKASTVVPVDSNIIGTGFFVSSSGIIVTNAHTVSDTTIKLPIIFQFIENSLKEATGKKDVTDMMKSLFTEQTTDFVLKNTVFSLAKDIIVLDPRYGAETTNSEEPKNIFSLGMPANLLSSNDLFYKTGDDIAVIQINGRGYPSNVFSKDQSALAIGVSVFTPEPGSVDVLQHVEDLQGSTLYATTLKEIVVVREQVGTSTPILATNSSMQRQGLGGPVVNASGEIVGMTTYQVDADVSKGTMPIVIIPQSSIRAVLKDYDDDIHNEKLFDTSIKKAFASVKKGDCDDAKVQFAVAVGEQNPFVTSSRYDPYMSSCYKAQAIQDPSNGDSFLVGMIGVVKNFFTTYTLLIALVCGFVLFVGIVFRLLRKRKQKHSSDVLAGDEKKTRNEEIKNARRVQTNEPSMIAHDAIDQSLAMRTATDEPVFKKYGETQTDATTPKKEEVFHTTLARFSRKPDGVSDAYDVLGSTPQKDAVFGAISEDDQKKLAALWPNKYGASTSSPDTTGVTVHAPSDKDTSLTQTAQVPSGDEENKNPSDIGETKDSGSELQTGVDYVLSTRKLGFQDDDIRKELSRVGWDEKDIEQIFLIAKT